LTVTKSTTVKYFIDTNILIYLFSKDEPDKREECKAFLKKVDNKGNLVISAQVLSEFAVVMLRKLNMPPNQLKNILEDLSAFEVVAISSEIVKKSVDIQVLNLLSFWDSQIVSAALSANCTDIVSEDLNHGQKIEGIEIVNPLLK
jgi:predicted nucleic acid-binding protein